MTREFFFLPLAVGSFEGIEGADRVHEREKGIIIRWVFSFLWLWRVDAWFMRFFFIRR